VGFYAPIENLTRPLPPPLALPLATPVGDIVGLDAVGLVANVAQKARLVVYALMLTLINRQPGSLSLGHHQPRHSLPAFTALVPPPQAIGTAR